MRRARRRGIALMDFIAGTVILAGSVTAWAAITRAQFEAISTTDRRLQAKNAAARALEETRASGIDLKDRRLTTTWVRLRTFEVPGLARYKDDPLGRVEARPLRADRPDGSADARMVEVRAVVRWRNAHDYDEVELSTCVPGRRD